MSERKLSWRKAWTFVSNADTVASLWSHARPYAGPLLVGAAIWVWGALSRLPTVLNVVIAAFAAAVAFVLVNEWRRRSLVSSRAGGITGSAVIGDSVDAQVARAPILSEDEKRLAKDALAAVRKFIDGDVTRLQADCAWIGGAPPKLLPRKPELRPLMTRAGVLGHEMRVLVERQAYGLGLVRLDLAYMAEAIYALEGGVRETMGNLEPIGEFADARHHAMINRFKEPACRANGELANAIHRARDQINVARARLDR